MKNQCSEHKEIYPGVLDFSKDRDSEAKYMTVKNCTEYSEEKRRQLKPHPNASNRYRIQKDTFSGTHHYFFQNINYLSYQGRVCCVNILSIEDNLHGSVCMRLWSIFGNRRVGLAFLYAGWQWSIPSIPNHHHHHHRIVYVWFGIELA